MSYEINTCPYEDYDEADRCGFVSCEMCSVPYYACDILDDTEEDMTREVLNDE